jgi:hypothetical protein
LANDDADQRLDPRRRRMGGPATLVDGRRLLLEQRPGNDAGAEIGGEQRIEFRVALRVVATSAVGAELDAVAAKLERAPGVEHATWESVASG